MNRTEFTFLSLSIIFVLGNQLIKSYYLDRNNNDIIQSINALYYDIYQEKAPAQAKLKLKMEQNLKSLSADQPEKNGFFTLIGLTAPLLSEQKNIAIQSINYQAKTLSTKLATIESSDIDTLITRLKKKGLSVRQEQINKKDNQTFTTLKITKLKK